MDQTISPEPQGQWEPQPASQAPESRTPIYPPLAESYTPPAPARVALMEAPQRSASVISLPPEEPRKRNPVWQAIKWPVRKLLLGIYYLTEGARKHTRETLVVVGLLAVLVVTSGAIYWATRPTPPPAPVAIEKPSLPALPVSVIHYLHARQRFDAAEMWAAYNPTARANLKTTRSALQTALNQERSAGLVITRYLYTGGFQSPNGTSHYIVEVFATEQGQSDAFTWYFAVGTDGLITQWLDVTHQ